MMRGERLRRLLIAWHNFLAEVDDAPLQIRIAYLFRSTLMSRRRDIPGMNRAPHPRDY
jgi:hypothetical protein